MFKTELEYFIAHQDELVALYNGKTLVIRGESVESAHATPLLAYLYAKEKFGLGNFMLQNCIAGPGAYTVYLSPSIQIATPAA